MVHIPLHTVSKSVSHKKEIKKIEGISDGFIVKDDIETGHGIYIPLWTFRMTY